MVRVKAVRRWLNAVRIRVTPVFCFLLRRTTDELRRGSAYARETCRSMSVRQTSLNCHHATNCRKIVLMPHPCCRGECRNDINRLKNALVYSGRRKKKEGRALCPASFAVHSPSRLKNFHRVWRFGALPFWGRAPNLRFIGCAMTSSIQQDLLPTPLPDTRNRV